MPRIVKLFTDKIINELGTYQPSAFHTNPDLVWNEKLMGENHQKILDIIRKKLKDVVIVFQNDIIDLSTRVTSYAIVKNVEWSEEYKTIFTIEYDYVVLREGEDPYVRAFSDEGDHRTFISPSSSFRVISRKELQAKIDKTMACVQKILFG